MAKRKPVRTRGKLQLSKYFQKFEKGQNVAVVLEKGEMFSFPERLQGRTGVIDDKKGKVYQVKINDQKKEKTFLIHPIHLKKIKKFE